MGVGRRVILRYVFPQLPPCGVSVDGLEPLSKGPSSSSHNLLCLQVSATAPSSGLFSHKRVDCPTKPEVNSQEPATNCPLTYGFSIPCPTVVKSSIIIKHSSTYLIWMFSLLPASSCSWELSLERFPSLSSQ